uniref:Popeye domain cAMP effector 3 n=1 Tax=Neolamprologus brichardi TaxID=32507 RepID=A0A3Q4I9V9_NEOBR
MEPPDFENMNFTVAPEESAYPLCKEWKEGAEGSVFHLANIFLFLGFMGGSGFYGLFYLFILLTLGFFCSTLWSWSDSCTTDSFLWSLAIFAVCLVQVLHMSYRLRSFSFDKDFQELYSCMFKRLGVSLSHFGKIVACCDGEVQTLEKDRCFAVEGKTAIDKLSVLLCGRRKKLYLLFAKHRYIAKIFALVVRNDIAEKLYSLSDKTFDRYGHRYDLRLPCYPHMPGTEIERADDHLQVPVQRRGAP